MRKEAIRLVVALSNRYSGGHFYLRLQVSSLRHFDGLSGRIFASATPYNTEIEIKLVLPFANEDDRLDYGNNSQSVTMQISQLCNCRSFAPGRIPCLSAAPLTSDL